ncbi:MAG: ABC-2 family transporter protein [Clostridiales bacterium]|nr:ABC-2 family transporter protein [Clostridiales bacterium]
MKKYLEVFRLSFKMQLVWRFDAAMTIIATAGRILAGWIVWQAIFEGKELVGGFTFEAMLSYYIVCSLLRSIDFSDQISGEVSDLIREGRFSGHMVTPIDPLGFFGSLIAGESAFHLGFGLIAAAACALVLGVSITLTGDVARILAAAAIIPTGLAFMAAFQYFIGILTFKFLDIRFFMYVQWNILAFVTGSMVPLSLLPQGVLAILRFLPFTHVVFTPTMLLTGQMTATEGLFGLAVIGAWAILMPVIARYMYGRLRVKYDGVGI